MVIPKIPKIPINLRALAKAGALFEDQTSAELTIEVLVDTSAPVELISLCHQVLEVQPGTVALSVQGFTDEMPSLNKDAGLTIVVAGSSRFLKRIMEISLWSELDCVIISQDAAALVALVSEEDALDIAKSIIEVDQSAPQAVFEHDLTQWCLNRLRPYRLALGAAFVFMRNQIGMDLTRQTAFENAAIAAVFFLPGADLPVLTLNQCKLLYQIAVIHEVPLSRQRLAELVAVMVAAFGFRGITRRILRKLPAVAWLVRGSTAFAATMAIGCLASELFQSGGGIMELVQGQFGNSREAEQTIELSNSAL